MIESTMSEIQLLKTCDHPNVLKYVAAYTNDRIPDHVFLVTQPWADMNLADFLGDGSSSGKSSKCNWWNSKDPFDRCCLLFRGLLDGLAYLHSHFIFHKDIKPENILLLGERPILADFGVSKLYRPQGQTRYTNSTYEYLAPEQITHESSTPQCDVFAMGCCFLRVMSVAVAGAQGLKEINKIFYLEDTSCQYGHSITIRRLMVMLQEQAKSTSWQMSTLRLFIRDMLTQDPSKRPTSGRLVTFFQHICSEEIKPHFLVRLPSRTLWLIDAIPAQQFQDPMICVLNAVINYKDGFKRGHPWVVRMFIPKGDGSGEKMPVIASVDSGSSVNLMSSAFIDHLTSRSYQLAHKPVNIQLQGFSGDAVHISRSVKCELRYELEKLSMSFLVLDRAEAYFDILLGSQAMLALINVRRHWYEDVHQIELPR
jgi:serine/threonine protein kinase